MQVLKKGRDLSFFFLLYNKDLWVIGLGKKLENLSYNAASHSRIWGDAPLLLGSIMVTLGHRGQAEPQAAWRSWNCAGWEVKLRCTFKEIFLKEKLCRYQAYFWFPSQVAIPYVLPLISSAILKTPALLTRISPLSSFVHSTSSPVSKPFPLHLPPVPNFTFPDPCDTRERESPTLKDKCVLTVSVLSWTWTPWGIPKNKMRN